MPSILGANTLSSGYDVANSVRFDDGDNARISKTFSSAGNSDTWTMSVWVKRSTLGANSSIFTCNGLGAGAQKGTLRFDSSDKISAYVLYAGSAWHYITSEAVYRDVSAWYHVVVRCDTTQGTDTDRLRLYVNGTLQTLSASTYPDQNEDTFFNEAEEHQVASLIDETEDFDGYMAEFCWIDGSSLAPTSFGEFDSDSNIWKPIDVSGLTFGTNGVYLDFEDSSDLGTDASGNSDWTATNLAATDQSTDTCTNNFCTLNPLYKQDHAFSEGNLGYTSSDSDWDSAPGTIAVSSGKWYVEMKITGTASGVTRSVLGLCDERDGNIVAESEFGLTNNVVGDNVGYGNGDVHKNNAADSGSFSTFGINDILGMYVDLDNGKVYFSKNGTMQNSGDPTSGSTGTGAISITTGATYLFGATGYGGGASQMNFGSPPYAV